MKKQLLIAMMAFAVSTEVAMAQNKQAVGPINLKPVAGQTQAALMTAHFFTNYHYKAMPLDDGMSAKIFDRYFKSLDGDKLIFLASDIEQFSVMRTRLDDAIENEDLRVPFIIHSLYQQRFAQRLAYSRELLKTKPDFTINESLQLDREKAEWPKNEDEVRDIWRKRVKNDWLRLKLAGKNDKAIRETLDKRYENYQKRVRKLDGEDVFQAFMNAYSTSIDPHTNYLGPRAAENFDISMRLSLEGIGAVLQTRDEYTVIREIVAGSPAFMSGKLKVGDRIVAVAQGSAPFVDVLGWRIDDVVPLVRGAKNSKVRLDVLPADAGTDAKHTIVTLTRQKIRMEEQAAKKSIIEVRDGAMTRRVGVVSLPTFYLDFEARRRGDRDYKSATRDVARILGELKKAKVDNVLIDLRNNGGGSLDEAIELTGLFIDKGPVVQHRSAGGKVTVEVDTNAGIAWDGPVGVLINRSSASASEIFAAAIQDYGRGLIIGEPTFGKGTVQSLKRLDENVRLGEIKMTTAQFFRINGGTTQLRGVAPDIKMPVLADLETYGESSFDNALPWTSIEAASFVPAGDQREVVAPLQQRHEARIAKDKDFIYLNEDLAEVRKLRKENAISLNEAVRRKERDVQEARAKLREARQVSVRNAKSPAAAAARKKARQDDGLQADERNLASELAAEKAAKDAKDVMLTEAAHILSDQVSMLATDSRLASRVMLYKAALKGASN
ncbi:carboxy terminal-processing peptidase [Massilia glaciei]|uniref:Tail-specific protease n=1 Tax=Massilia glaciei TaxID=1524097 RepID=A0A2U2HJP8_9BURK|nr:carboxy terminal-processing peptidase [Massilia glaciei]PWF47703.1 tail-specific protease [Massilia glaciei]